MDKNKLFLAFCVFICFQFFFATNFVSSQSKTNKDSEKQNALQPITTPKLAKKEPDAKTKKLNRRTLEALLRYVKIYFYGKSLLRKTDFFSVAEKLKPFILSAPNQKSRSILLRKLLSVLKSGHCSIISAKVYKTFWAEASSKSKSFGFELE